MLDKNQIDGGVTDPARSLARRHQARSARSVASSARPRRRLRDPGRARKSLDRQTVRLENRRHQRGRAKAHQCRWPDGRTHPVRDGHSPMAAPLRWRAMKCASPSPNSPFAWRAICRRGRRPTPCKRCSMRSPRCIRRSRFRIRDLRISSAPARRKSSPTMPARICSCWARRRTVELARARSGRGETGHHAARQAIHRSRQERARRSAGGAGLARQRTASARRDACAAGQIVTTGTCHRRCRSSRAMCSRPISA